MSFPAHWEARWRTRFIPSARKAYLTILVWRGMRIGAEIDGQRVEKSGCVGFSPLGPRRTETDDGREGRGEERSRGGKGYVIIVGTQIIFGREYHRIRSSSFLRGIKEGVFSCVWQVTVGRRKPHTGACGVVYIMWSLIYPRRERPNDTLCPPWRSYAGSEGGM